MEFKGFELDDSESKMLADQADGVTTEFIPQLENKWLKLILFITSLIGIFGKKYMDFSENENKSKPDVDGESKVINV